MPRTDSASFHARIGRFDTTRQACRPPPEAAVRRAQRALSAQGLSCHALSLLLLASCAPRAVGNAGIAQRASRDTRCHLPSLCSTEPLVAVASAFPHAFQRLSLHSQSASSAPRSTAFLLPSAAAAKSKAGGPAAKPGPPPKLAKPAVAGKGNTAARRASAFQGQRRGPGRALRRQSTVPGLGDNISPMEESRSAPRVAAAGAAITSNNADPLFAPLSKKNKPVEAPSYASERNDRASALNVSATVTVLPSPTTRDEPPPPTVADPILVPTTARFVPTCMLFHDAQQAVRQIRKSRRAQPSLTFCIHPKATPLFAGALSEAIQGTNGRGDWLAPFAVQHQIAAPLRQHPVHKLTGLGQRQAAVPARRTVPLGSDTLVSVLTISLRKDNQAPDVDADEAHLLTRNSFRLLRHTDLGGAQRLFIAYFVNRDNEVGAGHLEVIHDEWGMFSVEDAATGFVFSAGSLRVLVDHLQDISACRSLDLQEPAETPAETTQQASTEDPTGTTTTPLHEPIDLIPMTAGNLFVHEEETLSWTAPHPHLPYRRGVDLFGTVAVGLGDQNAPHLLFRNTFTLIADGVVYVDDLGRAGTLQVIADRRTGASHLRCAQPQDLDLAVRCGLYEGAMYSVAELAAALQSSRMLQIDDPPAATTAPAPAEEAGNTTDRAALPDEPSPDAPPPRLQRSGYSFDADAAILRYVDPQGRDGALFFEHVREPHAGFVLRPPSNPLAGRFAQRNGIDVGVVYTEGELVWHLDGEGYAREGLLA